MRYLLLLVTLCWLTACNTTTPDTTPDPAVPTLTTVPPTEAIATFTPEPATAETPVADPTGEATAEVTATEGTTDTPLVLCEVPVYSAFQPRFDAAGADATCPSRYVEEGDGAFQPFTNGLMIWASESDEENAMIYVLNNDGTWQVYDDLFEEGDPDNGDLTPPEGLLAPVRGFGLVWRNQLGGPDAAIGWALQTEAGLEIAIQEYGGDQAIYANGQVYWLNSDRTWE